MPARSLRLPAVDTVSKDILEDRLVPGTGSFFEAGAPCCTIGHIMDRMGVKWARDAYAQLHKEGSNPVDWWYHVVRHNDWGYFKEAAHCSPMPATALPQK